MNKSREIHDMIQTFPIELNLAAISRLLDILDASNRRMDDIESSLAMLADRIEAQKDSYNLAHSGLATHVFETIAKEIRAVAKELNP